MRNRLVFLLAILAVVFAYAGTQVASAPKSDTLPILPTPDFSTLTAYSVVRVVDGDTIVVSDKGKDVKVRLVGVDTPETVHPTKPVEHYGKEASRFTTNLLKGEKVYLVGEPLPGALDRYGRTLAYVYRAPDGLFVNAEIIRQGYGHAYTQIPSKYMQEFKQLEQFARKAKKGLWASEPPLVKPKGGQLSRKPVDEIKAVSKSMFGIYLGEKLSDVQNRFETTKYPLNRWAIHHTSGAVEDCHIVIRKDRVWSITVWLKDNTKRNFNILKQQLKKEYRKYQVREVKSSRSKRVNPRLPMTYDLQFKVTIDGIPIIVALTFTDNSTSDISVPNELSIQFIHLPLMEKVTT